MKNFTRHLIGRHTNTEGNVTPRLRGRFESDINSFNDDGFGGQPGTAATDRKIFQPDEQQGLDLSAEPVTNKTTVRVSGTRQESRPANENGGPSESQYEGHPPAPNPPQVNNFQARSFTVNNEAGSIAGENYLNDDQQARPVGGHSFNSQYSPLLDQNNQKNFVRPTADVPENNAGDTSFITGKKENTTVAGNTDAAHRAVGWVNESRSAGTEFNKLNISGQGLSANTVSPQDSKGGQFRNSNNNPPGEPSRPVIKVSIGRIEVRAIMPAPPPPAKSREPSRPRLTLDDFLSQHKRNEQ